MSAKILWQTAWCYRYGSGDSCFTCISCLVLHLFHECSSHVQRSCAHWHWSPQVLGRCVPKMQVVINLGAVSSVFILHNAVHKPMAHQTWFQIVCSDVVWLGFMTSHVHIEFLAISTTARVATLALLCWILLPFCDHCSNNPVR